MAKHTLNSGGGELDFLLLGLMSPENMYTTVSKVNDSLGIDLELSENVPFNLKEGKLFYFSLFNCRSEEFGLEFFFIPNSSNFDPQGNSDNNENAGDLFSELNVEETAKLIKELPKTDYFLIVRGEDLHLFQYKIIERLKQKEEILQVQMIEQKELPSRMNLVF
jgi:hypothetical protein